MIEPICVWETFSKKMFTFMHMYNNKGIYIQNYWLLSLLELPKASCPWRGTSNDWYPRRLGRQRNLIII